MKQVSHRGYLLVEVPEDAIRFKVEDGLLVWTTAIHEKTKQVENDKWDVLPLLEITEEWEIIGKGNEITETQWEKVVEYSYGGYHDYDVPYKTERIVARLPTANEAGYSLIKSHGMKPDTTLILKLKNNA